MPNAARQTRQRRSSSGYGAQNRPTRVIPFVLYADSATTGAANADLSRRCRSIRKLVVVSLDNPRGCTSMDFFVAHDVIHSVLLTQLRCTARLHFLADFVAMPFPSGLIYVSVLAPALGDHTACSRSSSKLVLLGATSPAFLAMRRVLIPSVTNTIPVGPVVVHARIEHLISHCCETACKEPPHRSVYTRVGERIRGTIGGRQRVWLWHVQ